jgi:hypothetical protein
MCLFSPQTATEKPRGVTKVQPSEIGLVLKGHHISGNMECRSIPPYSPSLSDAHTPELICFHSFIPTSSIEQFSQSVHSKHTTIRSTGLKARGLHIVMLERPSMSPYRHLLMLTRSFRVTLEDHVSSTVNFVQMRSHIEHPRRIRAPVSCFTFYFYQCHLRLALLNRHNLPMPHTYCFGKTIEAHVKGTHFNETRNSRHEVIYPSAPFVLHPSSGHAHNLLTNHAEGGSRSALHYHVVHKLTHEAWPSNATLISRQSHPCVGSSFELPAQPPNTRHIGCTGIGIFQ